MTDPARDRLAILVHEVRSPVAALAAIAEAYKDGQLEGPARRHLVELASGACRGIERLILDVAFASVRHENVDVRHLVDETVAAAVLGGGNVRADVGSSMPSLHADPLRLRQALDNLVSNALRHAGSSEEVLVRARRAGAAVRFSVIDQGLGIPFEEQKRIFEVGERLDTGRPGSGLGLAVARAIAETHGGTLTVQSAPGAGTTFVLVIPTV